MKKENPDGTNYRPANRLNAGVRRANDAARSADRCPGRRSWQP